MRRIRPRAIEAWTSTAWAMSGNWYSAENVADPVALAVPSARSSGRPTHGPVSAGAAVRSGMRVGAVVGTADEVVMPSPPRRAAGAVRRPRCGG